jgi:hypothetical protein
MQYIELKNVDPDSRQIGMTTVPAVLRKAWVKKCFHLPDKIISLYSVDVKGHCETKFYQLLFY